MASNFQSWAERASSTVHNAYNGNYTGFQYSHPPAPGPTGSYLPINNPLDPSNYAEVPAHQASGPPYGAAMQAMQAAQNNTSGKPSKKRKRATEEPTVDETADGDEQPNAKKPKEAKQPTKRSIRRQELIAQGYDLPDDSDKPMGKAKQDDNGQLLWCTTSCLGSDNEDDWVPAVYHNDRRQYLLSRADAQGRYAYPQAHGYDPYDRAAFHPAYANFNLEDRRSRPDVLFQVSSSRAQLFNYIFVPIAPAGGSMTLTWL